MDDADREAMDWAANNTAPEGTYGGADNGMDFYATVPRTSVSTAARNSRPAWRSSRRC